MRRRAIVGKILADAATPKLLAGYLVPFLSITVFFGFLLTSGVIGDTPGELTLAEQEAVLEAAFMLMAFFWAGGTAVIAATAVVTANTIARELETGTLEIVLSKPVRRRTVLLGVYGAVVAFATLLATASLLLGASYLYWEGGVSAAALEAGVFRRLPGTIAYAAVSAAAVAALGVAIAVVTANRLQTALGTLVVPTLYFAFMPVRIFAGETYEDASLYLVDLNYHFGNLFVWLTEAVGGQLDAQTQSTLAPWTGVYEEPADGDNLPETLDTVGFVPTEVSVVVLIGGGAALLIGAVYWFRRSDL